MLRRVLLPLLGVLATASAPEPVAIASQVKEPQGVITARMCVMLDLGKPRVAGTQAQGTWQPASHREIGAIADGPGGSFLTTTYGGGPKELGMVIKVMPSGNWEPWYGFRNLQPSTKDPGVIPDGSSPLSGLTKGSDGAWYGTTQWGGRYGVGTIFRITGKDHLEVIYHFRNYNPRDLKRPCPKCDFTPRQKAAMTAAFPIGPPIDDGSGTLYGVTPVAMNQNTGVLYKISKPWHDENFETICIFDAPGRLVRRDSVLQAYSCETPGGRPAGLTLSSGGQWLYGVLKQDPGHIFRAPLSGKPEIIHTFERDMQAKPTNIMQASDRMLYGTTYGGGDVGVGTVYRLDPETRRFEIISSLTRTDGPPRAVHVLGENPVAGLVEGVSPSGVKYLYGATRYGGRYNRGTLFRVPLAGGAHEVLHDFDLVGSGWQPMSTPVLRGDTVYGFTQDGGLYRGGTFYRLTKPDYPVQVLHPTLTSLGQTLFTSTPSTRTDDQVTVRTRVKASQTSLLDPPPPGQEDYVTDGVSVSLFCRNPQLVQFISRDIRRNGTFQKLRHTLSNGQEYDLSMSDDDDLRTWHHDGGSAQDGYYASGPAAGRRWDGPTRGRFGLTIYDKPTFPEWFTDPKTGQRARTIYDPANLASPNNEIWRARARVFAICNCEVKWEIFWTTDIRYNPANLTSGIRIWEDGVDPERIRIKPVPPERQEKAMAWINGHLRAGVDPIP